MSYSNLEPISKQLTIVVGLTVVGFMAFGLALSFYRNVLFEETLRNINLQNAKQKEKMEQGQRDLDYYRSAQYKDKYAKQNLSKINPGEKVLVLTDDHRSVLAPMADSLTPTEAQEAAYDELLQQMPVVEHWKLYLFNRDKILELKRGL